MLSSGYSRYTSDTAILKSNLMAGQPTRSKSWYDYEGLAIPPCNQYYIRTGSRSLVLPWLFDYSIVRNEEKWILTRKKKVVDDLSLHDEIVAFMKYMRPNKKEIESRQDLIHRFRQLLSSFGVATDASLPEPVGSYVTGLFLPASDIDMVITPKLYASPKFILSGIHQKLLMMPSPQFHKHVRDVLHASVPLLTITDAKTGICIDLTAEASHSKAATHAVSQWLKRDKDGGDEEVIRMLVMVVKTFLAIRRCGTTYTGGVNSYLLVWMVVAWVKLELPKFNFDDPSIASLSSAFSNIRLGGTREHRQLRTAPDYGKILIAFLEFYGQDFDYTKTSITISPEPRYTYKSRSSTSRSYLLSIKDPADTSIDVGEKAYAIKHVAESLREAYQDLRSLESKRAGGIAVGNGGILGKVLGGDFYSFMRDRSQLLYFN